MKWECSGTHIKVCVHQIKTDFKVLPLWRNSVPSFFCFFQQRSSETLRTHLLLLRVGLELHWSPSACAAG